MPYFIPWLKEKLNLVSFFNFKDENFMVSTFCVKLVIIRLTWEIFKAIKWLVLFQLNAIIGHFSSSELSSIAYLILNNKSYTTKYFEQVLTPVKHVCIPYLKALLYLNHACLFTYIQNNLIKNSFFYFWRKVILKEII